MKLKFLLLVLFFPLNVLAYYDYEIRSYDIDIVVNENNVLDIKETLNVYFNEDKYGIYRKIPLVNNISRNDGTTDTIYGSVSNINLNYDYSTYNENFYEIIKIGNSNYTVNGEHVYVLSYSYKLSNDSSSLYDEFYYNIVGPEWDIPIDNVSFSITMPKDFDNSLVGFSEGVYGSVGYSTITYTIENNVIKGYSLSKLNPKEAITIRIELPEGYFTKSHNIDFYKNYVIIIIFLIIGYMLWIKYGKNTKYIETVEFNPPDNLNPLEIAFAYNGSANKNDVISLLIYLAGKGYIKIEEIKQTNFLTGEFNCNIIKLKDYDGENYLEEMFLNGLFKDQVISLENNDSNKIISVKLSSLSNNFYITINEILHKLNTNVNKEKILEKVPKSTKFFLLCFALFTFIITNITIIGSYAPSETVLVAILFPGLALVIFLSCILSKNSTLSTILFISVWSIGFGVVPWIFMVLPYLKIDITNCILYMFAILSIVIFALLINNLKKRTPYGNELLGKVMGFKSYLLNVEKSKLEALVLNDPSYFYFILPYAYVLGVSDKWIGKFENISLQNPYWYNGDNNFNFNSFNTISTKHLVTMPQVDNTYYRSSSSGSGYSGGSSSGGGSGGGGGGSW